MFKSYIRCLLALALAAIIAPVIADQSIIADVSSTADSALSALSSLFKPSKTAPSPARISICCGDSCCPSCCNQYQTRHTDLAYLYPPPTPAPYTQSFDTKRPCCTLGCVDGACRIPTETLSQTPDSFKNRPRRGGHTSNTLNIVVGCCDTCTTCAQATTSLPGEKFIAEATPTAAPQLKVPLGPGSPAICIGCGRCHPCENAKQAGWVSFLANPSEQPEDIPPTDTATIPASTSNPTAASAMPAQSTTPTSSPAAEPTYYLGDDINDAINGQNQALIPLIIQSGSSSTDSLRILLATVDFKLSENYISRRILHQLSLLNATKPFPKGVEPRIAYLSYHQDKSVVDGSIVLAVVAGNKDEGTQDKFEGVRFFVYGKVDDGGKGNGVLRVPDVVVGSKFLREVGGLTVFPRFKTSVMKGVRVVYGTHEGVLERSGEGVVGGKGEEESDYGGPGHVEL